MTNKTAIQINQKLDQVEVINKELNEISYDDDGYDEKEVRLDELRNEIYELSKEFKNSDVIKTLQRMGDEYISPEGALDYWISSWC